MSVRGVIFDMDGVLMDTEPVWRRVEVEIFGRMGVPLTYEDTAATMGMRIEEVVRLRQSQHPWPHPPAEAIAAEIEQRVADFVTVSGEPMPGVEAALSAARDLGLTLGLCTSSSHSLVNAIIDRLQIREFFATFTSADDVGVSKPDPAVYLAAASSLGLDPADCLAIEDSRNGVLSALAAGMAVCAVPDGHWVSISDPDIDRADWKLETLSELPSLLASLAERDEKRG